MVLATSISLLGGAAAGCSTTQEKADRQQARAEHILKARKERQDAKKKAKHGKHGKDEEHGGGQKQ